MLPCKISVSYGSIAKVIEVKTMKRIYDGEFVHARYQAKLLQANELLHPDPIEISINDRLNCGKLKFH